MSTLAVFLVLGGGAAIAAKSGLPKNSVGTKHLRRGGVRTADIRNQAVTLRKIATSARTALRGQKGPEGPQGPAGTFGSVVARFEEFSVDPKSTSSQEVASCEPGERAVGGGVGFTSSPGSEIRVVYSAPGKGFLDQGETPTAWEGAIYNSEGAEKTARVYVVCAS
jgi:hypothetical protein